MSAWPPLSPPLSKQDVVDMGNFPIFNNAYLGLSAAITLNGMQILAPVTGGALMVCGVCGATVGDTYKHIRFHAALASVLGVAKTPDAFV